jgi:uncharacterized repeat protein (TIGR03803 family)
MPFPRQPDSIKSVPDKVLHSFNPKGTDGDGPEYANLLYANGVFYGTTPTGGKSDRKHGGAGTVFEVTASGTESVLYSFTGGADGKDPMGDLIDVNGVLYGTTNLGGKYGYGTVFEVTAGGAESVLYSFNPSNGGDGPDGANPNAGLVYANGVLYGTTSEGGAYGVGSVFEVTSGGTESVLYSFNPSGGTDGEYPGTGDLLYANGVLYGTTSEGGQYGYGTVFEVTAGGAESVLYSFNPSNGFEGPDGATPVAGLVYANGALYGTTELGGQYGNGTVFELTAGGTESVLHSFNGTDGYDPVAGLVYANGVLYGTTESGGKYFSGTVFEVTAGGTESVLHSFHHTANGTDGYQPYAGLVYANGILYGTTFFGGRYEAGTVFELTPPM